jgi:hypothetical protein
VVAAEKKVDNVDRVPPATPLPVILRWSTHPMFIPNQTVKIALGDKVQIRVTLGDADKNNVVDVSVRVRIIGFFETPPVVINLDMKTALEAKKGLEDAAAAFAKKK